MAVCECKCGLSKKEIGQKQSSEMEYFWKHKKSNENSAEEITAGNDLLFE